MIGHVVLLQFAIVDVNGGRALVLCDEGMLGARLKEKPGQEEVFAGSSTDVAGDFDEGDKVHFAVIETEEMIEIALHAVWKLIARGLVELFLEFVGIVLKRELAPVDGIGPG